MSSINGMLENLRARRESMSRQIVVLDKINDKSNNTLLKIESEMSKEHFVQEDAALKPYCYDTETEQSLTKAIELYGNLAQNEEIEQTDFGIADYIHQNYQNLNNLSSNVRKLLVVGEITYRAIEEEQQILAENSE